MNLRDFDEKQTESVEEMSKRYADYTQDELLAELIARVSADKRNGSFDKAKIEQFAAAVSPSLSPEQAKRLADLVAML